MNNFGNLISSRRKELKMTQKELALKLNVSDKTISKWETGASYPEITMLATITKALEMNLSDLFGVEDLQEKKIDPEEFESYDDNIINKYKNRIFLSIGLIAIGLILLLTLVISQSKNIKVVMMAIGLIFISLSLVNFISCNISFRSFYNQKFYTKNYDYVFFRYSSATIICLTLPFILLPFTTEFYFRFDTIGGLVSIFSNLIVIASYLAIIRIARISNFKVKLDILNSFLLIAGIIFFIIAFINFIPYTLLPFAYIIIYLPIQRINYLDNK